MDVNVGRGTEERFERKAGLVILITIVALITTFLVLGRERDFFKKRYNLVATFTHGGNIDKNTGITLAGLKVGNVVDIYINKDNKINVVMSIQNEYHELVRKDSVATLVYSLLTGSVIDISIGSKDQPGLEDGDSITSAETTEVADTVGVKILLPKSVNLNKLINEEFSPLISDANSMFKSVDGLFTKMQDPSSEFGVTARQINEFSRKLNESNLIENGDKLLTNANELTSNLNDYAGRFPELFKNVEKLVVESNNLLSNLRIVSEYVKESTPELPEMLGSVSEVIEDLNEVLEASKKSFLLKKYFKNKKSEPTIINEEKRELLLDVEKE